MPAEAIRLRRRLGVRDRVFVATFAAVAVAAVPIGLVFTGSHGSANAHCVTEQRTGFMGAEWSHVCGAAADARCSRIAAVGDPLAAQCRRIGD